ncbi:MAG: carboxymuconolactone decarboxylase family protein [Saprospiraceae bacterium]
MKNFPDHYQQLVEQMKNMGKVIPIQMKGFADLHKSATADGALTKSTKELIALGIAITVRCDGCIAFHVHDAIKAGSTQEEIMETIGVAILMGGGPAVVYGCEAMEALKQFVNDGTLVE